MEIILKFWMNHSIQFINLQWGRKNPHWSTLLILRCLTDYYRIAKVNLPIYGLDSSLFFTLMICFKLHDLYLVFDTLQNLGIYSVRRQVSSIQSELHTTPCRKSKGCFRSCPIPLLLPQLVLTDTKIKRRLFSSG